MEPNQYKISGFCNISKGTLHIGGEKVFQSDDILLDEMLTSLIKKYNIVHPRFGKMDRLAQLGYSAIEILLQLHPITKYTENEVGILLSNNSSSLDNDLNYQASIANIPSPALFVYTLPNIVLAEVCIKNKLKGENLFFISDIFNATQFHMLISEMLDNNRAKACIAGWVDVLGSNYNAMILLIEKRTDNDSINEFTISNLEKCLIS
jgi:hypothetical protein